MTNQIRKALHLKAQLKSKLPNLRAQLLQLQRAMDDVEDRDITSSQEEVLVDWLFDTHRSLRNLISDISQD